MPWINEEGDFIHEICSVASISHESLLSPDQRPDKMPSSPIIERKKIKKSKNRKGVGDLTAFFTIFLIIYQETGKGSKLGNGPDKSRTPT